MKAERHALLLATCLALGVGVVGSAASTSASCPSASNNARWGLLAQRSRKTTCGCGMNASAGWGGVRVRGGAVVSDQYNARMQVMITRNMRKVLVDELDYLPDEVDDMDPQIAAVVIEKSLPRPRAGMPIAWRRSIRQTGSSGPPNPFRYLTDAIQATLEGVVNGAVAVVSFPFVVVGRAAGAVQRGGVTGVAAAALCLGLVAALVTSDSGAAPGDGDADDLSPRAAGLQALGSNLAAARTMLLSRGRGSGGGEDASGETRSSKRETRGGGGGRGGRGGGDRDGGAKKAVASAEKAGGRRVDADEQKGPKAGGKKLTRDEGNSSSSSSSNGRRRNADGNFRDTASRSSDGDDDDDDDRGSGGGSGDDGDGDDWKYPSGRDERGGFGSKKKPKTKRLSAPLSEQKDPDDLGRQQRAGVYQKKQARGSGTSVVEAPRERLAAAAAAEKRGLGTGRGAGGAGDGEGEPKTQRPKSKVERKRRRGEEVDSEEVCPDAPVSPNAGGAVWFEDLPPAPPAPDTIGVLDEEEEEGLLGLGADQDRRPRWGRKPMSEHIPSEEEMETWDSKIEASDTWLDRGINKAMGSLFGSGGGGDGDSGK